MTAMALTPCCRARPYDLLQHMAVSAMHTVKIADAHYCRPEVSRHFFEFVKDFHRKKLHHPTRRGID